LSNAEPSAGHISCDVMLVTMPMLVEAGNFESSAEPHIIHAAFEIQKPSEAAIQNKLHHEDEIEPELLKGSLLQARRNRPRG
jgi:hypothetical protein